jgi:hypothetical protein
VQVPQKPAPSHTWLVPQVVPAAFGDPSVHTGLPVVHDTTPLAQLALGLVVHAAPWVQETQFPAPLQTRFDPQLVPAVRGGPFTHTGPPEEQETTPVKHAGLGLVVQEAPSVHATQFPSEEQTWLVPQLAPVAFCVPLTQVLVPVAHEVVPVKHGLGLALHAWPAVQLAQVPAPSHTWLVPQLVPADLLPESRHTCTPEVQEVTPVRQAPGFVVQAWPAVQLTHAPAPSQTWFVPQPVPAGLLPESAHTRAPEPQVVRPVLHTPGLVLHVWPAVQLTQLPDALHTWLLPQAVPVALFAPSTHVVMPVVQLVCPCLQMEGLLVHVCPAVHMPQKPLPSHTWPAPQSVPAVLLPESTHVCAPVAQLVTPVRHGEGLVPHAWPAVHDTHVPAPLHTWFAPQLAPAGSAAESRHVGVPVLQSTTPARQGAPGLVVHDAPALHARHCPLPLHTWPVPQLVPGAAGAPSAHDTVPPHTVEPTRQGAPGLVAQLWPDAQTTQSPARQTRSTPQPVPVGASAPSTHWGVPVVQEMTPCLHGPLGLPVQLAPAWHAMHSPAELHTWPAPQLEPAGRAVVVFAQPGVGEQTVAPSLQASELVLHAWPAWQVTHWPPEQSWLVPHTVPSAAGEPSRHEASPVALQLVTPWRQGEPGLVPQLVPSEQEGAQARPPSASTQSPLAQSPAATQALPSTQGVHVPPQSTSLSPGSRWPLAQAVLPSQRPRAQAPPSGQLTPLQPTSTQPPSRHARPVPHRPSLHARGMHCPCTQVEYALHITPRQLVSLQVPSTQTKPCPHSRSPQLRPRHWPPAHALSPVQALPQAPQCTLLEETSTQAPEQDRPPSHPVTGCGEQLVRQNPSQQTSPELQLESEPQAKASTRLVSTQADDSERRPTSGSHRRAAIMAQR